MLVFRKICIGLTAWLAAAGAIAASHSVQLHYRVVNNFPVKYVSVDMRDPEVHVTTGLAPSFPRGLESWGGFINRLKPDAAINGTYFSVDSGRPVGDVACNGALVYRGSVGTALCITPQNQVSMRPGTRFLNVDWSGYRTVLSAGPRLLADGKVALNPQTEGFRDPRVLGSASRSAIAFRKDGRLLLISVPRRISLRNLAWVCQKMGAVQAMALDGGSSSGLYADRRTVTRPSRKISNIIAVYATPARYAAVAQHYNPDYFPALTRLCPPLTLPTLVEPALPAIATPTPTDSLVQFVEPDSGKPAGGTVPITVTYAEDSRIAMCTLRINGQLRAMSNTRTLSFLWDSTKETDGIYTLEAAVLTGDNTVLATESRSITVQNSAEMAVK